jgi:hypothetical protein
VVELQVDQKYDINTIYSQMEQDLIASYQRNMSRHSQEEIKEGFKWEMWQSKKLRDLQAYKKESRRTIDKRTKEARNFATGQLISSYGEGANAVDVALRGTNKKLVDEGFGMINRRKLDALIDAVNNDLDQAGQATLRLVDDQYRQIIYKSQIMYNAGAQTLPQSIDMAAKDFLAAGINCIQYANGAKVNIASYAEMVLRTSAKKAYLTGEGARAAEWGEFLVQVTTYGGCSPTCIPWQGRVYVDDVYAGGKDTNYPKLSTAMANGLYHPNCRHTHGVFFEGISDTPEPADLERTKKTYEAEQKQRGIERNIRKYKRLSEGSIDPANKAKALAKTKQWQGIMRKHLDDNPFLSRRSYREKVYGIPAKEKYTREDIIGMGQRYYEELTSTKTLN